MNISPVYQRVKRVEAGWPYNGLRNALWPDLLTQRERMAKGGVIGTDGKGVIALRFDDYQDVFRTDVFPLVLARNLPASHVLISRFQTEQPWGVNTTWDDIRNWNRNGAEMWSHGTDHKDYFLDGYAGLVREIVTSREEIEIQNLKCVGWAKPGVTSLGPPGHVPFDGLGTLEDYNSDTGRLLVQTYGLTEANAIGSKRPLPTGLYHGLSHVTISDGITLAAALGQIEQAWRNRLGIELMVHSANLGLEGNITLTEFAQVLDEIVAARDAGRIEVLTPSGMCFADPSSSYRMDMIADGGFEGLTTVDRGFWLNVGSNGITIESSGGHTGTNFASIPGTTATLVRQSLPNLAQIGIQGEVFEFQGWFRSNGTANTVGRVIVTDLADPTRINLDKAVASDAANWTLHRFCFCIPPNSDAIDIQIGRSSQDGVDWDDVSVRKV